MREREKIEQVQRGEIDAGELPSLNAASASEEELDTPDEDSTDWDKSEMVPHTVYLISENRIEYEGPFDQITLDINQAVKDILYDFHGHEMHAETVAGLDGDIDFHDDKPTRDDGSEICQIVFYSGPIENEFYPTDRDKLLADEHAGAAGYIVIVEREETVEEAPRRKSAEEQFMDADLEPF